MGSSARWARIGGVVAVLALVGAACTIDGIGVRGSGDVITESRDVSGFDSIRLSGSGTVTVELTGTESLLIEAEDNIMEFLTSEVSGGTLELGSRGVVSPTEEIRYTVTTSNLVALSISGSGDITTVGPVDGDFETSISGSGRIDVPELTGDSVSVDIGGSGTVLLAGEADDLIVSISGSGDLDAFGLAVAVAEVTVSGSGDARVNATDRLDARISGSGNVEYLGTPAIDADIGGSGSISQG